MNNISLNLFFGQIPNEDFIEDLSSFNKLKENEISKLIDKVIEWYTKEDIDKEWDKWFANFTEEEKKEKKSAIRIILFIFTEFVAGNVNDDELKEDFENLNLPQKYIDHFIKKLKPVENEFRKKALRSEKPYENNLIKIDWRIDTKKHRDEEEKNVAVIEFLYFSNGEKKVAQIDLNPKALKHLIYRLNKIEEELWKAQAE